MYDVDYQVKEKLAILSESGNYTKEINRVSFNGAAPKYDIRNWKHDGSTDTMMKGIALSFDEARALKAALNSRHEL